MFSASFHIVCLLQTRILCQSSFLLNIKFRKQPNNIIAGSTILSRKYRRQICVNLHVSFPFANSSDDENDKGLCEYILLGYIFSCTILPNYVVCRIQRRPNFYRITCIFISLTSFRTSTQDMKAVDSSKRRRFVVWNHAKTVRYKVWNKVWIYFSWNRKHFKLTNHYDLFWSHGSTGELLCSSWSQVYCCEIWYCQRNCELNFFCWFSGIVFLIRL